jgi:hypothetical protein
MTHEELAAKIVKDSHYVAPELLDEWLRIKIADALGGVAATAARARELEGAEYTPSGIDPGGSPWGRT